MSPPPLLTLLRQDMQKLEVKGKGIFTLIGCLFIRPGFLAVFLWRLSSRAIYKGLPGRIAAKCFWRLNVLLNACDMEPLAVIGGGFHVPHPMGIVFGRITAGENFKIHQNVTIGMRRFTDNYEDRANYPMIGNNVTISAGAVIAGAITVGNGAMVGANCVLMCNVPENSLAVGIPSRIVMHKIQEPNG